MDHEVTLEFEDSDFQAYSQPDRYAWIRLRLEGVPLPDQNWVELAHMLTPLRRKRLWKVTLGRAGIRLTKWRNEDRRKEKWTARWSSTAALRALS